MGLSPTVSSNGEVAEWLKAPVLKTGDLQRSVGSNPTLSANAMRGFQITEACGARDRLRICGDSVSKTGDARAHLRISGHLSRCSSSGRAPDLGSGGRVFESPHLDQFASVAQLAEHLPSKQDVAGSSPVTRSNPVSCGKMRCPPRCMWSQKRHRAQKNNSEVIPVLVLAKRPWMSVDAKTTAFENGRQVDPRFPFPTKAEVEFCMTCPFADECKNCLAPKPKRKARRGRPLKVRC